MKGATTTKKQQQKSLKKRWESCRKEGPGTPEELEAPGEIGTRPGGENKTGLYPQGQGTAVKPYSNTC